jgi:hypothetical protein
MKLCHKNRHRATQRHGFSGPGDCCSFRNKLLRRKSVYLAN